MAYTTIKKPSDYFNTVLYTGDGSSLRNITGVGFQPDWVWFKQRSGTQSHTAIDAVRTGDSKIRINATSAEFTGQSYNFNSDGFGWTTQDDESNQNGATYASWNWLGSNTTAANTDGSISSTVSANTTSGFSIVKYTGDGNQNSTVGHGLGNAPKFIVIKHLNDTVGWNTRTYHSSLSANQSLYINDTAGASTIDAYGGISSVGVNTFGFASISSNPSFNAVNSSNSINYIAYCFAEKQGFSKFGSYTGNGSTDGTFVYTGFKPAFVILKASSVVGQNWMMFDNKRNEFNVMNKKLYADNALAEETSDYLDFTSNGYKLKTTSSDGNGSGTTYIYMAFAEEPLVGDNPATAR